MLNKNTKAYANKKISTREYNKVQMRKVSFYIHRTLDADMVEWLNNHKPMGSYIKNLIKEDMKKGA